MSTKGCGLKGGDKVVNAERELIDGIPSTMWERISW
jgi:hypothetical protein